MQQQKSALAGRRLLQQFQVAEGQWARTASSPLKLAGNLEVGTIPCNCEHVTVLPFPRKTDLSAC